MEDELDTIISSFVFTLMAIKGLKPVADKVGLLDVPNHRKQHKGAVPLIGGVSIFIGVAISALLFMSLDAQQKVLLAASLVIVVMGVFDDLYDLSVRLRLGIQAVCTLILCTASIRIFHTDALATYQSHFCMQKMPEALDIS